MTNGARLKACQVGEVIMRLMTRPAGRLRAAVTLAATVGMMFFSGGAALAHAPVTPIGDAGAAG